MSKNYKTTNNKETTALIINEYLTKGKTAEQIAEENNLRIASVENVLKKFFKIEYSETTRGIKPIQPELIITTKDAFLKAYDNNEIDFRTLVTFFKLFAVNTNFKNFSVNRSILNDVSKKQLTQIKKMKMNINKDDFFKIFN